MPTSTTTATAAVTNRPVGLLTPADVAEMLGLPVATVRSWVRRGLVRCVRFGPRGGRIALEPSVIDQLRREA